MGALLDAASDLHRGGKLPCSVAVALAGPLGPDLAVMLADADRWNHAAVARAIRRVDPDRAIASTTIGRHRRGDCSCPS